MIRVLFQSINYIYQSIYNYLFVQLYSRKENTKLMYRPRIFNLKIRYEIQTLYYIIIYNSQSNSDYIT